MSFCLQWIYLTYWTHKNSANVKRVMGTSLRLTSTAILLIALQAFNLEKASATSQPSIVTESSAHQRAFGAEAGGLHPNRIVAASSTGDYEPPPNGGPGTSGGAGTR